VESQAPPTIVVEKHERMMNNPIAPPAAEPPMPRTDDKSSWITPALLQEYAQNGFVVLRGFCSDRELELLRNEADRVMGGKEGVLKGLERQSAFFERELTGGGHYSLVSGLVCDELKPSTCGYFDKPVDQVSTTKFAPAVVEPHRDGGGKNDGATLWIALDGADVTNGCLHYIPGSHTAELDPHAKPFSPPPEGRTGGVPAEVSAGDAIIHSAKIVHFSEASTIPKRRRAVNYFYTAAASVNAKKAASAT
jgi:hypothetical protein